MLVKGWAAATMKPKANRGLGLEEGAVPPASLLGEMASLLYRPLDVGSRTQPSAPAPVCVRGADQPLRVGKAKSREPILVS